MAGAFGCPAYNLATHRTEGVTIMAHPVRADGLRRVNAHIPAEVVERAIERFGMRFGDNMSTLVHAAILAAIDERVSEDVLTDARERAPRRRGPGPGHKEYYAARRENASTEQDPPQTPRTIADECGISA